jgi:cation:H+ antiporter
MENFSTISLLIFFVVSGALTWMVGITLAKTTDTLDTRFKIGDAIGGLVFLGISGTLPEIAVCGSAARTGNMPVIIGNLIGGLAIQVLLIVFFDMAVKGKRPLSYLAGTKELSVETIFAIILTVLALLGTLLPQNVTWLHASPFSFVIVIAWLFGLYGIDKIRNNKKFNQIEVDASLGRRHQQRRAVENHKFYANRSTWQVGIIFLFACLVTLVAGVVLEQSGTELAGRIGMSAGLFAATAIALVTSLPEISTGLESIFIGDNHLAISDIMGGNAFMLTVFLFADLVAQKPVLAYAQHADIFLALLAIAMMAVYAFSFIKKPQRRYLRMGWDSILQIVIYVGGIIAVGFIK